MGQTRLTTCSRRVRCLLFDHDGDIWKFKRLDDIFGLHIVFDSLIPKRFRDHQRRDIDHRNLDRKLYQQPTIVRHHRFFRLFDNICRRVDYQWTASHVEPFHNTSRHPGREPVQALERFPDLCGGRGIYRFEPE